MEQYDTHDLTDTYGTCPVKYWKMEVPDLTI